jgi:hypothetical protein
MDAGESMVILEDEQEGGCATILESDEEGGSVVIPDNEEEGTDNESGVWRAFLDNNASHLILQDEHQ